MREAIKKLSDKALARVLGEDEAGACIPNSPYYKCYHHAKLYCSNNCAGEYFCHQVGSC